MMHILLYTNYGRREGDPNTLCDLDPSDTIETLPDDVVLVDHRLEPNKCVLPALVTSIALSTPAIAPPATWTD
jgi:hypothetical protein